MRTAGGRTLCFGPRHDRIKLSEDLNVAAGAIPLIRMQVMASVTSALRFFVRRRVHVLLCHPDPACLICRYIVVYSDL